MARIVPAKPKVKSPHAVEAVTKLQSEIGDEVIIFQNLPAPEWMLALAPGKLPVFIAALPDVQSVDLDAQEIASTVGALEIPDLMATAIEYGSRMSLGDAGIVILSLSPAARRTLPRSTGIVEAVVTSDLFEVGQAMSVQTTAMTADAVNALLQMSSPGASAFVPGTVTQAQIDWRAGLVETNEVVPVTTVTAPAQVSTEKFKLNEGSPKRVENLETMVGSVIFNLAKGRQIIAGELPVQAEYVADKAKLLPVLLVAASEKWSPVVAKAGTGGFDVRLTRDETSLVGYRVSDVLASSPYLLYMPLARVARAADRGQNMDFTSLLSIFDRWLSKHDLGRLHQHSVTIRIATEQHLSSQDG